MKKLSVADDDFGIAMFIKQRKELENTSRKQLLVAAQRAELKNSHKKCNMWDLPNHPLIDF